MKKDLFTYGLLAIIGVIVAYFVCNLFLPEFSETSFKTLTSNPSYTLSSPDPEVFNFRAINPTVEVYVGQCEAYNPDGTCADIVESDITEDSLNLMEEYFNLNDSGQIFEEGIEDGDSD